jgi:hypothetical protein
MSRGQTPVSICRMLTSQDALSGPSKTATATLTLQLRDLSSTPIQTGSTATTMLAASIHVGTILASSIVDAQPCRQCSSFHWNV